MFIPRRLRQQTGRHALVDGIPFTIPVRSYDSPALMAGFPINADRAAEVMPGNELHPLRFMGKGLLMVAVIDYRDTDIGTYVEYSLGIGCTRSSRPVPWPLALLLNGYFGVGQYVIDLPVNTEISVKGGKGIWGMPKHHANLDFRIGEDTVGSRYDKDGQMVVDIEIDRPTYENFPVAAAATNWCSFRGMLMKSDIYIRGRAGFSLFNRDAARLTLGDSPKADVLHHLDIDPRPIFTVYLPTSSGTLDDHFESWFLTHDQPPTDAPEGMESVIDLGHSTEWLPPPGNDAERKGSEAVEESV